jgi:dihydroneopterin aldolase
MIQLTVEGLRIPARLGVTTTERAIAQDIEFDLALDFSMPPLACKTDVLADTVCYSEIAKWIQAVCDRKEYSLIEHLAFEVKENLRSLLPTEVSGGVLALRKFNPPMQHRVRETAFRISL